MASPPKKTFRRMAREAAYSAGLSADRLRGRRLAHMIHVGKTGGTALATAINGLKTPTHRVVKHGHDTTIHDIPVGDGFLFVVRDPVERFRSAFKSRQRKGRPRWNVEWRASEKIAFERFETAHALALGLSSPDQETREAATYAFRHIAHVRDTYATWFEDWPTLWSRRDDVIKVLALERFDADFEDLKSRLGLPASVQLPTDPVKAHRTTTPKAPLSDEAVANLARWYEADYEFLDHCAEHFGTPRYERPS